MWERRSIVARPKFTQAASQLVVDVVPDVGGVRKKGMHTGVSRYVGFEVERMRVVDGDDLDPIRLLSSRGGGRRCIDREVDIYVLDVYVHHRI